jgi:hypothetical protein
MVLGAMNPASDSIGTGRTEADQFIIVTMKNGRHLEAEIKISFVIAV